MITVEPAHAETRKDGYPSLILPRRCDQCGAPFRGNGITIKTLLGPREMCCRPCLEEFIALEPARTLRNLEDRMLHRRDTHVR